MQKLIRKYKETDIENVIDIWYHASLLAHPFLDSSFVKKVKKDMRELYIPNGETWVYVINNKVVAFISMIDNEIGGLFVSLENQAKGIGSLLVDYVSEIHKELEVEVFLNNKIGRPFYKKYGFKRIKEYIHEETQEIVLRLEYNKQ